MRWLSAENHELNFLSVHCVYEAPQLTCENAPENNSWTVSPRLLPCVVVSKSSVSFYTVSQKSSHLLIVCNFVESQPISKIFALLESIRNLLPNPDAIAHHILGMLLHYLWKLKLQIFCRKQKTNCIFNRPYLCYSSTNFDIFGV